MSFCSPGKEHQGFLDIIKATRNITLGTICADPVSTRVSPIVLLGHVGGTEDAPGISECRPEQVQIQLIDMRYRCVARPVDAR